MNIHQLTELFKHKVGFYVQHVPDIPTLGITNETEDNCFVPFLDYDGIDYEKVCKDLWHLHRLFGLCSFVILCNHEEVIPNQWGEEKTVGNYLVFGFDKLSYQQHCLMQSHTRSDALHKRIAKTWSQRNWVNRVDAKYEIQDGQLVKFKPVPVLKDVVHFGPCNYKHSRAHLLFFRFWYGVRLRLNQLDGYREVEFIEYSTVKK